MDQEDEKEKENDQTVEMREEEEDKDQDQFRTPSSSGSAKRKTGLFRSKTFSSGNGTDETSPKTPVLQTSKSLLHSSTTRLNPFDRSHLSSLPERMKMPTMSPSVFKTVQSPSQEETVSVGDNHFEKGKEDKSAQSQIYF